MSDYKLPPDVLEQIRQDVAAAPPISAAQRDRIVSILSGASSKGNVAPIPVRRNAGPTAERRCALYRHFDGDGVLLYVGISSEPVKRNSNHARHSAWMTFAVTQTTEWFEQRADALEAERVAIQGERPLFNGTHATEEARTRAVKYLVDKNALHLLRAT